MSKSELEAAGTKLLIQNGYDSDGNKTCKGRKQRMESFRQGYFEWSIDRMSKLPDTAKKIGIDEDEIL